MSPYVLFDRNLANNFFVLKAHRGRNELGEFITRRKSKLHSLPRDGFFLFGDIMNFSEILGDKNKNIYLDECGDEVVILKKGSLYLDENRNIITGLFFSRSAMQAVQSLAIAGDKIYLIDVNLYRLRFPVSAMKDLMQGNERMTRMGIKSKRRKVYYEKLRHQIIPLKSSFKSSLQAWADGKGNFPKNVEKWLFQ